MKVLILMALVASSSVFAENGTKTKTKSISCRDAIIDAQKTLGNDLAVDSFSSMTFDEYDMTAVEFNTLDSEEQGEIYQQIKPIEVMVDETISDLNRYITHYNNSPYAFLYISEVDEMRDHRDSLRACSTDDE